MMDEHGGDLEEARLLRHTYLLRLNDLCPVENAQHTKIHARCL